MRVNTGCNRDPNVSLPACMWYRCNVADQSWSLYAVNDGASCCKQPILTQPTQQCQTKGAARILGGPTTRPKQDVTSVTASVHQFQKVHVLEHQCASKPSAARLPFNMKPAPVNTADVSSTSVQVQDSKTMHCRRSVAVVASSAVIDAMEQRPAAAPAAAPGQAVSTTATPGVQPLLSDTDETLQPLLSTIKEECSSAVSSTAPCLAEVRLQCQSSADSDCASTACPYSDPLLHWSECWSGPGVCRRQSGPVNDQARSQQQHQHEASGRIQRFLAPAPTSPRSPTRPHYTWWANTDSQSPRASAAGARTGHIEVTPPALACATHNKPSTAVAGAGPAVGEGAHSSPVSTSNDAIADWIINTCCCIANLQPRVHQHAFAGQQQQQHCQQGQQQQQQQPTQLQQQQQPHLLLQQSSSAALAAAPALPQRHNMLSWWLFGGVALAALSGSAVLAVYGVMAYMMKASMVYSFAWKAATGVAAAEGLAVGGWGCRSVRRQRAAAAQSAAELARLRSQAASDLASLRGLLEHRNAAHERQVSGLSAANERLTQLAKSLRSENSNLQSALDRAQAERKSLEAAAALECSRAETKAVCNVAAAHSERVASEVAELRALVMDLREDFLGLLAEHATPLATTPVAAQVLSCLFTGPKGETGSTLAKHVDWQVTDVLCKIDSSSGELGRLLSFAAAPAGPEEHALTLTDAADSMTDMAADVTRAGDGETSPSSSSGSSRGSGSSSNGNGGACQLVLHRLKSVRGNVDAALAASVAETLEL